MYTVRLYIKHIVFKILNFFPNDYYPEMNPVTIVQSDTISSTASLTASDLTYKKLLFCANRGSGKSTIVIPMVKMVQEFQSVDHITIISPTERMNPYYGGKIVGASVLYKLEENFLDSIPALCERSKHVLLVLDDSVGSKNKVIINKIHELIKIPNLTLFCVAQYPIYSCDIAKDFDLIFFGKESLRSNVERMFGYVKSICSIDNFNTFNKTMKNLHEFSFVCVKNTKKTNTQNPKSDKISDSGDMFAISRLDTFHDIDNPSIVLIGQNDQINVRLVKTIVSRMELKIPTIAHTGDQDNKSQDMDMISEDIKTQEDTESEDTTDIQDFDTINMNKIQSLNVHQTSKPVDHLVVITKYNKILYEDLTESIYDSSQIIKSILKEQVNTSRNKRKHYMIVIEWVPAMFKQDFISELLFNGKHYNISSIVVFKYPIGLTPELRSNFDMVYVNAGSDLSTEKRLYDHYFGMFPCFKSFRQFYEQICESNESFIVVVNRGTKKSIIDKIKWFSPTDTFLMRYPLISLPIETESLDIDSKKCNDDSEYKNIITELKTKYNDQQGLIKSISILLELAQKESNTIKKLIDKLSADKN